jgi:hypothetical protein
MPELNPGESAAPSALRRVRELGITHYLEQSASLLQTARSSIEISELMEQHGYGDDEFAQGMALLQEAEQELAENRLDPDDASRDDVINALREARENFAEFREVARAVFRQSDERATLGVHEDIPDDLQRFINAAHRAYTTATVAQFAEKLARRGYTREKLFSLSNGLVHLSQAGNADVEAADEEEPRGEEAYFRFKEWMKEFKGTARGALSRRPDLLARLPV